MKPFKLESERVCGNIVLNDGMPLPNRGVILFTSKKERYYWYVTHPHAGFSQRTKRNQDLRYAHLFDSKSGLKLLQGIQGRLPGGVEAHLVPVSALYRRGYVLEHLPSCVSDDERPMVREAWLRVGAPYASETFETYEAARTAAVEKVKQWLGFQEREWGHKRRLLEDKKQELEKKVKRSLSLLERLTH